MVVFLEGLQIKTSKNMKIYRQEVITDYCFYIMDGYKLQNLAQKKSM